MDRGNFSRRNRWETQQELEDLKSQSRNSPNYLVVQLRIRLPPGRLSPLMPFWHTPSRRFNSSSFWEDHVWHIDLERHQFAKTKPSSPDVGTTGKTILLALAWGTDILVVSAAIVFSFPFSLPEYMVYFWPLGLLMASDTRLTGSTSFIARASELWPRGPWQSEEW